MELQFYIKILGVYNDWAYIQTEDKLDLSLLIELLSHQYMESFFFVFHIFHWYLVKCLNAFSMSYLMALIWSKDLMETWELIDCHMNSGWEVGLCTDTWLEETLVRKLH